MSEAANIRIDEAPLRVGSYTPRDRLGVPLCGRRQYDGLAVVLPPLCWSGTQVTDPDVLRQLARSLDAAADWLDAENARGEQDG